MTKSSLKHKDRLARFVKIYVEQTPKLLLAITRNKALRGSDDAKDVIQDLFVKLYAQINDNTNKSGFGRIFDEISDGEILNYLYFVVRNSLIDRWRHDEILERGYTELLQFIEPTTTPETILADRELITRLRQCIAALRPTYRELLKSLIEEDTTLAAFARRKNIKIGTIYTKFSRALEALRAEWHRQSAEPQVPSEVHHGGSK